MAATWPSIIPLGATTSAPASAWATAIRWYSSSVASLSTSPVGAEHAAVPVVGVLVEAQVGHQDQLVAHGAAQRAPARTCTMPSGSQAPLPMRPCAAGTPKRMRPGHAQRDQALGLDHQRVDGVLHLARHRRDGHRRRRGPRARRAGPPGRRPRGGSRRPGGAGRACGAADAGGGRATAPDPARVPPQTQQSGPWVPAYEPSAAPTPRASTSVAAMPSSEVSRASTHAGQAGPMRRGRRGRADAHDMGRQWGRSAVGSAPLLQGAERRGRGEDQGVRIRHPRHQPRRRCGTGHRAIGLDALDLPPLRPETGHDRPGSQVGTGEQDPTGGRSPATGKASTRPCALWAEGTRSASIPARRERGRGGRPDRGHPRRPEVPRVAQPRPRSARPRWPTSAPPRRGRGHPPRRRGSAAPPSAGSTCSVRETPPRRHRPPRARRPVRGPSIRSA